MDLLEIYNAFLNGALPVTPRDFDPLIDTASAELQRDGYAADEAEALRMLEQAAGSAIDAPPAVAQHLFLLFVRVTSRR